MRNTKRTKTEIKLLQIRQNMLDALHVMEREQVVPLLQYRKMKVRFLVVEELLTEFYSTDFRMKSG